MKKKELKELVKNGVITKPIYNVYRRIKDVIHKKKREKGMQIYVEKGPSVMKEIQQLLNDYGLKNEFFFAHGTALGIIRDGHLIDRDMDIDMVVIINGDNEIKKFREYMNTNGYDLLHSFFVDSIGMIQDAFQKNGIMVDINYSKVEEGKYYTYVLFDTPDERNRVLYYQYCIEGIEPHEFNGFEINLPIPTERYLEQIYGENWRIPDKNYIYWKTSQVNITDLKGTVSVKKKFDYA